MKTAIAQANEARKALLRHFGPAMEVCTLTLTDRGFVIDVVLKAGEVSSELPAEVDGVPIRYRQQR